MKAHRFAALAAFAAGSALAPGRAAAAKGDAAAGPKITSKLALAPGALAPLPSGTKAAWSHGPFEEGNCGVCHQRKDPKNPGPLLMPGNELCFSCHEEFSALMRDREHKHPAAAQSCSNCHNSHNSRQRKLLLAETKVLCLGCHEKTRQEMEGLKVVHGAVNQGSQCTNCHNPHAANVEKLLVRLPFDLCVSCHNRDDVKDYEGKPLTNFKKWLDENPNWHAPVAAKDCSACHKPHGSENFRLLTLPYPAQFYAPYDAKNYALCFDCHNDQILAEPKTLTLTRFRNNDVNLHYLHVNKVDRGRTCRACHEVHASKQPHHIREGVPYGPKGWILKINYTKTSSGGSCAKTCHATQPYDNRRGGSMEATKRR